MIAATTWVDEYKRLHRPDRRGHRSCAHTTSFSLPHPLFPSPDLWYRPRLAKTCAWSWRLYGICPAVLNQRVVFIGGVKYWGDVPLCCAGRIGDLVIYRVMVCSLSERCNGGQSIASQSLSDRGDTRMSMRQVELTAKLLTNRMRACTLDEFFNLNCW